MTRTEVVTLLKRWWAAVAVAAAAIVTFFDQIKKIVKAITAVSGAAVEVWSRWGTRQFVVVLGILALTVGVLACIWWSQLIPSLRTMWNVSRRELAVRGGISATLLAVIAGVVTVVLLHDAQPGLLTSLLSQAGALNAIAIRTYGNNGTVSYDIVSESGRIGPPSFARITFKPYGNRIDHNCGWIIMFQPGTNLSRFQELRFFVRGSSGDEKIGVKAKDAHGNEVPISLNDPRHIAAGKITSTWQEAIIPLDRFGNVDLAFFENLSLYVSGDMVGPGPQTIDVGAFEFRLSSASPRRTESGRAATSSLTPIAADAARRQYLRSPPARNSPYYNPALTDSPWKRVVGAGVSADTRPTSHFNDRWTAVYIVLASPADPT